MIVNSHQHPNETSNQPQPDPPAAPAVLDNEPAGQYVSRGTPIQPTNKSKMGLQPDAGIGLCALNVLPEPAAPVQVLS